MGRPLGTWRVMKDKDLERSGKSWNDIIIKKLAQDREGWKVFVYLYPVAGPVRQWS